MGSIVYLIFTIPTQKSFQYDVLWDKTFCETYENSKSISYAVLFILLVLADISLISHETANKHIFYDVLEFMIGIYEFKKNI